MDPAQPVRREPALTGSTVDGLLLAAGAGTRMGMPKVLLADDRGTPMAVLTAERLLGGGCGSVTVVLGAAAEQARHFLELFEHETALGEHLEFVVADDWADGMSASLRAGLEALLVRDEVPEAVLISLVDLPDVGVPVMERVVTTWQEAGAPSNGLVRATYAGRPGHPVLIGRDHWPELVRSLSGDSGAQAYLSVRRVVEVPCDDLATGRDLDRPPATGSAGDVSVGAT